MYIDYYNSIKQLLNCHLEAIKTIDWFNDQYERYEDLKAIGFPAVYIEFEDDINWQTVGNGEQQADTQIVVHLVVNDLKDSPESVLTLAKQLHQGLHGKLLSNDGLQLSTELVRSKSQLITTYDQLKVMRLTYDTTLMDYSTARVTRTVNLVLKASGELNGNDS